MPFAARPSVGRAALLLSLAAAGPTLAADTTLTVDAGFGWVVKNNTGAIERLRVDEATGNLSRNDALFAHTTGNSSTFVGRNAGNTSTTGGLNTAFGYSALTANAGGSLELRIRDQEAAIAALAERLERLEKRGTEDAR